MQDAVSYTIRMEPGVQTPEETLAKGSGSCRDSGWLLVHVLRRLGLAARFVSGYLIQLTPDVKAVDGPSGTGGRLHRPARLGRGLCAGRGLDRPRPDLRASSPARGTSRSPRRPIPAAPRRSPARLEPCEVEFHHEMAVARVREEPRVTFPFTEEHWARIDDAGQRIDAMLRQGDVRLTMGGEPTFVAADDRDADEWNTEAVGPTKRHYADRLIRRLRDRFAPGGLLHFGQGKWYPGEQLPRWAFGLYWRKDGAPLWGDAALIAPEAATGATMRQAEAFAGRLAEAFEIDPGYVEPAFEDPATYVLQESRLPVNLDPETNRLDDPLERRQLARAFERGLEKPVCMVMPVQLAMAQAAPRAGARRRHRWETEKWRTRRERLYLAPGDSAAGYRLPLTSLPYLAEADYPFIVQRDPFADRAPLPERSIRLQARGGGGASSGDRSGVGARPGHQGRTAVPLPSSQAAPHDRARAVHSEHVRTAITVEPRDGKLCVFLPPVPTAEAYVDMVGAVEETAAELGLPVHIDGYAPPFDPRFNTIKATPDPGVIEVNIHPTDNWADLVEVTEALYEEARWCKLDTVKFLHDGRQVGSGGGNHIVVGGATPDDSPFLRRPDLLASLVRYWQNHPSLSYLFSGIFIGPTSQAPRVDEARQDVLYELEIALDQAARGTAQYGPTPPPWIVDRVFRDLLTDLTGNTHRSEICIDKLYEPASPTGRLGLVEFRAFEMPPHPRMSLAQSLVLRALIARFWATPYTAPLVRHGTALHDRWMLPHFVWADFLSVLRETGEALGLTLDPEWFKAQVEFRFPLLGDVVYRDVTLELRAAIEPWNVLGETGAIGGTARYVDSSLERIQVKVRGSLGDRYRVACNRIEVPLAATDRADERVAGIRFRAWAPAQSLHPTIGVHAPLTFDLYDDWTGRSLGGCTYHVAHPGGRSFETQPVNDLEAEGRRMARFVPHGHGPGFFRPAAPRISADFPLTLDLRRQ